MFPKAVIFDFDGVIVDTEPLHYRAFQKILAPIGLGFTWDEYVQTYMGYDDRDAFREAFVKAGKPLAADHLADLVAHKATTFQEVIADGVQPYPGVLELITRLHRNNVPLAISSGALLSDIRPIIQMLKIDHCFSHIVTADDVQQSKPDPASYLLAASRLRTTFSDRLNNPDEIIAIEDTPAGITSAKGAGLQVVAVTNSYPKDKLMAADRIVDSLELLIDGF